VGVMVANESSMEVDAASLRAQGEWLLVELGLDAACELSVALVDEDRMAQLHEQWMGEPGPTDVLSFPMDDLRIPGEGEGAPVGVVGDVILCPQVALRQASDAGHATSDELALLLTHGVLHCLGLDHAEPEEHERMFALQAELLAAWRAAQ